MGSRPACSRPRPDLVEAKSAKTSDYRVLERELKAKVGPSIFDAMEIHKI